MQLVLILKQVMHLNLKQVMHLSLKLQHEWHVKMVHKELLIHIHQMHHQGESWVTSLLEQMQVQEETPM